MAGKMPTATVLCQVAEREGTGRGSLQFGCQLEPGPSDAGQFALRLRAPAGTRIEKTEQLTLQTLELIKQLGLSEVVLSKEEVEDVRERLRHGQAEAVAFVVGARQRRTRRAGR